MKQDKPRPQIGVISDCALQRHILHKALNTYGLHPVISCEPDKLLDQAEEKQASVQCWILNLRDESYEHEAIDQLIDQADHVPVLFGLDEAPRKHDEKYISWERRLFSKLEEYLGSLDILESEDSLMALDSKFQSSLLEPEVSAKQQSLEIGAKHPSDSIWVLAASLGGPEAVKEFLDEIPANIKAGFLYAQHIDAHFSGVLTKVLGRHSMLDLVPISEKSVINDGEVLVVPVDKEITFSDDGILVQDNAWDGPYGPSIDHLLKNLLSHYGTRCNVIVFSGMGNDGAMMAPRMYKQGCSIWTQNPDECGNGSMPQSIIDLECSHMTASPKELARALIDKVGCHHIEASPSAENLNQGV